MTRNYKGPRDYFEKGTWNYICPVCGFKYKANEIIKRWDGLWVCKKDWEPRHQQDFLRARKDEFAKLPIVLSRDGAQTFEEYTYVAVGYVDIGYYIP